MILISATYFTVNWLKFFQRDASSRGVFKISPTRSVDVNFMEKTGIYNYCESTDLKAKIVEMPLENKILELVMVLPNEINGLAFIESRLNAAFVDPKYKEERVNVIMPKVAFDFKLDLRKVFQHVRFRFSLGKRDTVSCSWGSRRASTWRATSAESPPKNRSSSSTTSYTRASSISATKLLT
ncbi:serine protease inhibitor 3/4-like [Tenebrio molitor]|uniref:serine protease inhibitor 3/4-like n=1 Tax=Tenebrio molitor TaxID=7067 RepID=UPI0036248D13